MQFVSHPTKNRYTDGVLIAANYFNLDYNNQQSFKVALLEGTLCVAVG